MQARLPAIALLFLIAFYSNGNAQTVTGNWVADYPTHMRGGDGEVTIDEMGHADIMFVQKGDSVRGVWHPQTADARSRLLMGSIKGTHITFASEPIEAQLHGGGTGPVMVRTFFDGELRDGLLTGTMRVRTEDGSIELAPVKWSAKRKEPPTP